MLKPSDRLLKQALKWFVLLQAEQHDAETYARFAAWLARSEAHQAAYAEAERLWDSLDGVKTLPRHAWETPPRKPARIVGALALLTALGVAAIAAWWDYRTEPVYYQTAQGQRRQITLAEGSTVDLNGASRLAVRLLPWRREVRLEQGEALFDVRHSAWRPFIVQAGALRIRDIGTRFDVDRKAAGIRVTVLEGAVELDDGQAVRQETLTAGYRRDYQTASGLSRSKSVDPAQASAWREGRLLFKHTPLAEVAAEWERQQPVHFQFADPGLAQETLSGTFAADDLGPFLRALEKILPVRIERNGSQILIRRGKS